MMRFWTFGEEFAEPVAFLFIAREASNPTRHNEQPLITREASKPTRHSELTCENCDFQNVVLRRVVDGFECLDVYMNDQVSFQDQIGPRELITDVFG